MSKRCSSCASADSYRDYCLRFLCEEADNAYGYLYFLREDVIVSIPTDDPIPFNTNGILKGITHDPNNNPGLIVMPETGRYEINYVLDDPGQVKMALELNGTVVLGSTYSPSNGASVVYGQVIIEVLTPNSILELVNKASVITFNALVPADDPNIVLVSIFIEKIDEL